MPDPEYERPTPEQIKEWDRQQEIIDGIRTILDNSRKPYLTRATKIRLIKLLIQEEK